MESRRLFARVRALWPSDIKLGDARAQLKAGRGIAALNQIYWDGIEGHADKNDAWLGVAVWAFHQALCEKAERAAKVGSRRINPRSMTVREFEEWMFFNLSDDDWKRLRLRYRGVMRPNWRKHA